MKKQFKIKNRQKRKYTRHNAAPESTFSLWSLFVGTLPVLILAITCIPMLVINLNLRDQVSSIQPTVPEFVLPTFIQPTIKVPEVSLPNFFLEPMAFIASFTSLVLLFLQSAFVMVSKAFIAFFMIPDSRPLWSAMGESFVAFFQAMGVTGILVFNGFLRIGELFSQSMSLVGMHLIAGSQTISAMTIEYATRAWNILSISFLFIFQFITWTITTIFNAINTFVDGVVKTILIPFQITGALWLKIKPYVDILGIHIGMAGADFTNGVNSFNELGETLQQ